MLVYSEGVKLSSWPYAVSVVYQGKLLSGGLGSIFALVRNGDQVSRTEDLCIAIDSRNLVNESEHPLPPSPPYVLRVSEGCGTLEFG